VLRGRGRIFGADWCARSLKRIEQGVKMKMFASGLLRLVED